MDDLATDEEGSSNKGRPQALHSARFICRPAITPYKPFCISVLCPGWAFYGVMDILRKYEIPIVRETNLEVFIGKVPVTRLGIVRKFRYDA